MLNFIYENLFLIIIIVFSINANAKIPGYFIADISNNKFISNNLENSNNIYYTDLYFEYGIEKKYFKPFFYGENKTFYRMSSLNSNHPFLGVYTIGLGLQFYEIFYLKYEHGCSHRILTDQNLNYDYLNEYPREKFDNYKLGIKIKIE